MSNVEFGALLFWTEVASVVVTALFLKRWMLPPPEFGGRYWRALLASLASLPVTVAAVFGVALAVGYPPDESYSPGIIAGQFLISSVGRSIILWPFVLAWLIIKPRSAAAPAALSPQAIRSSTPPSSPAPAPLNKAPFFRGWKNVFGQPEVEGIDTLSDHRINEIYAEVRNAFCAVASKKKEPLPDSTINGLVRDLLMEEVNGAYAAEFAQATATYNEHPIQMLFWKGRAY